MLAGSKGKYGCGEGTSMYRVCCDGNHKACQTTVVKQTTTASRVDVMMQPNKLVGVREMTVQMLLLKLLVLVRLTAMATLPLTLVKYRKQ